MSSIELSGLATGLDTARIVEQLMQVERRRLTTYQSKLSSYDSKKSAITELQAKVSGLKSALNSLSDASQLRSFTATSGDEDVLTVEAGASAFEGSHTVEVKQLASPERWIHSGFKYATSYVSAAPDKFILSYNDQELIVDVEAGTTLQGLVDKINNDPNNPGVTAGILEYDDGTGNPFHLVLSGKESGSDYQITINSSNTEVHKSAAMLTDNSVSAELTTKLVDLQDFSKNGADSTVDTIRITGSSHGGTNDINTAIDINSYSTVEDLLEGIESAFGGTVRATLDEGAIVITDKVSGASNLSVTLTLEPGAGSTAAWTPPTITLSGAEGGSIHAAIAAFDPDPAAGKFTELQDAQDALLRVDGYPPGAWISRSSNTIDDVITGVTLNLHSNSEVTETDPDTGDPIAWKSTQVSMNRDTKSLKEKINAMVEAYNTVVMFIDEKTSYDEKAAKVGVLSSEYSLTTIQTLIRTPLISNAVGFNSNDAFMNPRDIGLELDADGMLSLDEKVFDEAIAEDYLDVLALIGAQKTGTTTGTGASVIKFYQASQYTKAGSYDVKVDTAGQAWIKLTGEDWSQARQATIENGYIIGSMETTADKSPVHPEYSLYLKYDGTAGTEYIATVNLRQGFTGDLHEDVSEMLKSNGRIPSAQDSIKSRIDAVDKQIEREEIRLERYEQRLKNKYARLESTLQSIQQQMSGLMALR